jgi:hypothetical protein
MPKPTSRRSSAWAHGYEPGSVYAGMTPSEQKAYKQWLKDRAADDRAYERGLSGTKQRSARNPFAEV